MGSRKSGGGLRGALGPGGNVPAPVPASVIWGCREDKIWRDKSSIAGTSLVVQWLRLRTSTAGGVGLIPGGRTKIPHALWCAAKKKKKKFHH